VSGTSNEGNAQQLPNGNTLYCLALSGTIVEVNSSGSTLWSYTASGGVSHAYRYSACQVANAAPAIPTISASGNVLTSSAATTYQWYVDGVLIPGATSQSYSATVSGAYVVRVTDANGCWYSYSLLYDHTFVTGIENFNVAHNLNVFPIPTTGIVNLNGEALNGYFSVSVYDGTGREVFTSANEIMLDLSFLNSGMYLMNIRTENSGVITKRISIVK
jgi:hypothetical protein